MKKLVIILLLIASVIYGINEHGKSQKLQAGVAEKVLRFHVLANSDSKEDQSLKLKVRDSVGRYLKPLLEQAKDRKESEQIVNEHMDEIISVADSVVAENGYDYNVKGQVTTCDFPDKEYGDFKFPEGEYRALQLVIGEGSGHNWWCVLYPNLCFEDTMYDETGEGKQEKLKETLTADEYEYVFDSGKYEIKFKVLEWLEEMVK